MFSNLEYLNINTKAAEEVRKAFKELGSQRHCNNCTWVVGSTLDRQSSNVPSSSHIISMINKNWFIDGSDSQYTIPLIGRQLIFSSFPKIKKSDSYPFINTIKYHCQRGLSPINPNLRVRNSINRPRQPEEVLEIRNGNMFNINYQTLYDGSNTRYEVKIADKLFHSSFQSSLLNRPSPVVDSVLASACKTVGFDIAEMWLRTGPKRHQLTNTHLRPTALDETVRNELVDIYYGERSSERTHRLSPALCKRAIAAMDVVWVTAYTENGAKTLRCSISDVRTAVAVPVFHINSNSNITIIFFSIRRSIIIPCAVEFLVHISLAAALASVNDLPNDIMNDLHPPLGHHFSTAKCQKFSQIHTRSLTVSLASSGTYQSVKVPKSSFTIADYLLPSPIELQSTIFTDGNNLGRRDPVFLSTSNFCSTPSGNLSVIGSKLNLNMHWECLRNMEYLTDGGYSWIHTAVMNGKPVVVKTLKPECQDLATAINEIEGELEIHRHLNHLNIVSLCGAGMTSKGSRFIILERLDGGTLSQYFGYNTRIRDRRRRFWRKSKMSYLAVLRCARSIADAMRYCNDCAINGSVVLHRDLKPDNIGFTLDGTVKLIDFGLAKVIQNASSDFNDVYIMSGKTGSFRYMAPEVATSKPYNHKVDVYSFGIILWELMSYEKPFYGMNREQFYQKVVIRCERPVINKKWPEGLVSLMTKCWSFNPGMRPTFSQIVDVMDGLLNQNKEDGNRKNLFINRPSSWF